MSHGDEVQGLGERFVVLASTPTCANAAIRHKTKPIYGLQFHPEVTHTEHGSRLIGNFVKNVCGCEGTWEITSFIDAEIERGSVLLEINREPIGSPAEYRRIARAARPGDVLALYVYSPGGQREIKTIRVEDR